MQLRRRATWMIPRQRLSQRLNGTAAITILRGAAGTGKTVLLTEWANAAGREHEHALGAGERHGHLAHDEGEHDAVVVWVALDESTATRLPFWRRVLAAASDAGLTVPRGSLEAIALGSRAAPDLPHLLARVFESFGTAVVLVIDDYHLVTDDAVGDDLVRLLEAVASTRLVVATRVRASLEANAVAARIETTSIPAADLAFTRDEVALVMAASGVEPDAETIEFVLDTVGGHALATRLAVLALEWTPEDEDSAPTGAELRDRVLAAIATDLRELLDTVAPDARFRDFLVSCAVPERLDARLAGELTDLEDAAELLIRAEQGGLGHGDAAAFRYSPAVRAALLAELHERMPGRRAELERRSARWFREQHRYPLALEHAVNADDLALASAIVREMTVPLPRPDAVLRALGSIPLQRLRDHPLLAMTLALGYAASPRYHGQAGAMFGLAIAGARLQAVTAGPPERALLLTLEAAALRLTGRTQQGARTATRALQLIERLKPEDADSIADIAGALLAQNGLTLFTAGETSSAREVLTGAYAIARDGAEQRQALSLLAASSALAGELTTARSLIATASRLDWPEGARDSPAAVPLRVAEAASALEEFDFSGAALALETLAPHRETTEHWPLIAELQAYADLGLRRPTAGATRLAAAIADRAHPPQSGYSRRRLDAALSLLLLAGGTAARAEAALRAHGASDPLIAVALARIALLRGQPEQGIRHLDDARGLDDASPRIAADGLLLRAAASLRLGHPHAARAALEAATAIMTEGGVRLPLALVPRADRALFRAAAEASALFDGVDALPALLPDVLSTITLSDRELVVLRQLAGTGNSAELAEALFVSVNTVKSQLRSVYRKLGVSSREGALLVASEHGLLDE